MARNQEEIRATVPAGSAWHTEDIEAKAARMGVKKGDFVLHAVDAFINFDDEVMAKIEVMAKGLRLPVWTVMQNMIIDQLTEYRVLAAQGTPKTMLEFQAHVDDNGVPHTLTGKQLYDWLLDHKTRTVQRERDQRDNPLHL